MGVCKVHKTNHYCCFPPFRTILSVIRTFTYKLAEFLLPKIYNFQLCFKNLPSKFFFAFAEEIVRQDGKTFFGNPVESRFTNISLNQTINICTYLICDNVDFIKSINRSEFENLLCLVLRNCTLCLTIILQKKGWCGHGITLTNYNGKCFMISLWIEQYLSKLKLVLERRFVDDNFVLFKSAKYVSKSHAYLNIFNANMYFSLKEGQNNKLSFLYVEVFRQQGEFNTTVYRKPTFSSVYIHFGSFFTNGMQTWYDIHSSLSMFWSLFQVDKILWRA